jgi:hypothetical protein
MWLSVPTAAIPSATMSSVRSIGRFSKRMPRSAQSAAMISIVMLSIVPSLAGGVGTAPSRTIRKREPMNSATHPCPLSSTTSGYPRERPSILAKRADR